MVGVQLSSALALSVEASGSSGELVPVPLVKGVFPKTHPGTGSALTAPWAGTTAVRQSPAGVVLGFQRGEVLYNRMVNNLVTQSQAFRATESLGRGLHKGLLGSLK